jgi:hypothetical protein
MLHALLNIRKIENSLYDLLRSKASLKTKNKHKFPLALEFEDFNKRVAFFLSIFAAEQNN